jgi:quercetin dioxygenase-like cupin family protein
VEVDCAPGAASQSHTHAKSAFIYAYVISGAIESKVNDGETRIYRAGESWSEPPGAIHSIGRIGVEHDGAMVEVKTRRGGRGILVLEHAEAIGVEFGTGFPSVPHRL